MSKSCSRGQDAATHAVRKQAEIIAATAPGVKALDQEAIHDMRVASRRLRMALQVYQPYYPGRPRKALRKQARRITVLLGKRRELDVMAAMLREHREETHGLWQRFMDHAIALVDGRREGEVEYCLQAVALAGGDAFRQTCSELLDGTDTAGGCSRKLARRELAEAFENARFSRRTWSKTGDADDLHQVRIALKHLRYACEFHRDLYGEPMDDYITQVKAAQSLLGDWNECRLLEEMVLAIGNAADYSLAQGAPLVAEAYGNHAADLAGQFQPLGRALFGRDGRHAFKALIRNTAVGCCPK